MNKDQVKGGLKETKGTIKEVTGKIVGKKSLEQKGKVEKVAGQIQSGYGDLKEDLKNG